LLIKKLKLIKVEKFLSYILDLIDKYYHQKKINEFLIKLNLKKVIDIGAHKGEFLENIISIKNRIKVYSFEPQSKIFKDLKKKFKNKKNINLFNLAISNSNKFKKLNINIKTSTSTFSSYNQNSFWKKIKDFLLTGFKNKSIVNSELVLTNSLDSFCKKKKIKNIDLLKIDTEGHEMQVLDGAKKLLKNDIKFVLIEFHLSKIYKDYNSVKIEKILKMNNFVLLKKFKFPFLLFEDRIYTKKNIIN
tara:strand:+ start:41 stop:778 length:738 start_codon:yes stop_codon:yes gene_type:complete